MEEAGGFGRGIGRKMEKNKKNSVRVPYSWHSEEKKRKKLIANFRTTAISKLVE